MASPQPRSAFPVEASARTLRDLPLDGEGALFEQIYRAIRSAILEGRVAAGTRLPTTRALARELGLSRNTVVSAFEPLRAEGFIVARVGSGTFVAPQVDSMPRDAAKALPDAGESSAPSDARALSRYGRELVATTPRWIHDAMDALPELAFDFRPCVPDLERLPLDAWRRALSRTANYLPNDEFDYGDPAGVPALREAIAEYLSRARGVICEANEVVIVGGVAQALDLSARLFVDPGETVVVEDPHYLGARRVFRATGAELVGAPIDAEGIRLDELGEAARGAAKVAYVTPSHQFPKGAVMSLARRQELLRWAEEEDVLLIEDDYDSEFRYSGPAIKALKSLDQRDRVLYVGTFSKTLLPALRIAYVVLPRRWVDVFRCAKWLSDWASPAFEQHALAGFLASGDFERHVRRARTLYGESRAALIEAMDDELGGIAHVRSDNPSGLHLLVGFPEISAAREAEITRLGFSQGVGLYPSRPCYLDASSGRGGGDADSPRPTHAPAHAEWIFGFGRHTPAQLREGVRAFRRLLDG